jgi:hypothetical protein
MENLQLTAAEIKLKVTRLLEQMQALEKRCMELQSENDNLKNALAEQKNSSKALEETNKMLKIAEILHQKEDSRELKKLVAGYIREIDECLRLLSNK